MGLQGGAADGGGERLPRVVVAAKEKSSDDVGQGQKPHFSQKDARNGAPGLAIISLALVFYWGWFQPRRRGHQRPTFWRYCSYSAPNLWRNVGSS